MWKKYQSAQVFSFGILLALALWGTTAILEVISHHWIFAETVIEVVLFSVLVALAWISAPLTLRGIKWGFVLAIIMTIVADIGMVVTPNGPFTGPFEPYTSSYILYYIISTVGLYFYYKGYKSSA
ncbi:MAG: hypothetical protein H3Z52_11020 [archaeon]|nr:hypothetical protein [archaeon]MCP8321452.1 hypothetical protein [archaeon]